MCPSRDSMRNQSNPTGPRATWTTREEMDDAINLDDLRWLTGDTGCAVLSRVATDARSRLAIATSLRETLSPEKTRLVLDQLDLRRRATQKFDRADAMFFTKRGLEQATDQAIAAHKALRFPTSAALADFCCGIGGDLIALAERGSVTGVDADARMVEVARANVRASGGHAANVIVGRAEEYDLSGVDAWHCDPDRRANGRRTTQIEFHTPSAKLLRNMLNANPNAAIKFAPGSNAPEAFSDLAETEWEWISHQRECRQLVAWSGVLGWNPGRRVATVVGVNGRTSRSFVGDAETDVKSTSNIAQFVLVPDPAVFAASLGGALAETHGLKWFGSEGARPPGYLTGEDAIDDPLISCFVVSEIAPFKVRRLSRLLRDRGVGRLEIKHRGLRLDPVELRKRLRLRGPNDATLLCTSIGARAIAILAHRV